MGVEITIKTFDEKLQDEVGIYEESWLIFANRIHGEFLFNLGESTGLNCYPTYSPGFIQQDLGYLKKLKNISKQNLKIIYQVSAISCMMDDSFYSAEGQIHNGYPDGKWIYNWENGSRKECGYYKDGKKHGIWTSYYQNGQVSNKSIYCMGEEVKRKEYSKWEEVSCEDDECAMWSGRSRCGLLNCIYDFIYSSPKVLFFYYFW